MKRAYSKPSLYVEPIKLDMPIAANCLAERADMKALMSFGYFNMDNGCMFMIEDCGQIQWGDNTICYHSNVQIAFMS